MKAIKKPVPVEVWKIHGRPLSEVDKRPEWVEELYSWGMIGNYYDSSDNSLTVKLDTLEGEMTGHQGDYLVQGNHDDVWIVKRDIFEDTYTILEDD